MLKTLAWRDTEEMSHLTTEQLDEIVRGLIDQPDHVTGCEICQGRVAEANAVRGRLRTAFASVEPDEVFMTVLRTRVATAREQLDRPEEPAPATPVPPKRRIAWPRLWRTGLPLSAAAAIIIGVVLLVTGEPGTAQAELEAIHQANLSGRGAFLRADDPEKVADLLKTGMGCRPRMLACDGVKYRGGCLRKFRDGQAGTYIVDACSGQVSIVVARVDPDSLGFGHKGELDGQAVWWCRSGKCNLVMVRKGELVYIATGFIEHQKLRELIVQLLKAEAAPKA